ncbi:MAG: hypothetical protein KF757_09640 [Phycisphaeraceae bacterium]|nr:hypothetical protein [Phycisphaeraceae bacterium]MCW5763471.1 hypothetical protein [Phycisphaeraceae bacterium]
MKIRLDDTLLEMEARSVAEALELGRGAAEKQGRLIIEVHADGSPLPAAMLDEPPDHDAGIGELRLLSTLPGPFIQTTLLDAADLLGQVRTDQAEAVRLFQSGHIEEAFGPLQRALTSWAIVRDVVDKSATLGAIDPESVRVEAADGAVRTGPAHIDTLSDNLTEIKRALQIQDFSALAEVLEIDMNLEANQWERFLQALADQAGQIGA